MIYIKFNEQRDLLISRCDPIYIGENLNQRITFLMPPTIDGKDTSSMEIELHYKKPDKTTGTSGLDLDEYMYAGKYLQYSTDVTYEISEFDGIIYLWLEIFDSNEDVFIKSSECSIEVINSGCTICYEND